MAAPCINFSLTCFNRMADDNDIQPKADDTTIGTKAVSEPRLLLQVATHCA